MNRNNIEFLTTYLGCDCFWRNPAFNTVIIKLDLYFAYVTIHVHVNKITSYNAESKMFSIQPITYITQNLRPETMKAPLLG